MRCLSSLVILALFQQLVATARANELPDNIIINNPNVMSRQECLDQGGVIVGDIGNGAIHQADYVCDSNGESPIGTIVPADGEPIAIEGEVCCGPPVSSALEAGTNRTALSRQECSDQGGIIIGDIGNGAIHRDDYLCDSTGESPIGTIVPADGEPIAIEGEVCCGPWIVPLGEIGTNRTALSRQECSDQGGIIIGDIGNGTIHQDHYICDSTGESPIGTIVSADGEPIAIEGEVCCGPWIVPVGEGGTTLTTLSRQECSDQGGIIVGDIGNGTIHQDGYTCDSTGESPIGTIVPADGEPIATEGEVCCGPWVVPVDEGGTNREILSRQECLNQGGNIVGDIGDGAVLRDDYICESSGEFPVANIVPASGEAIATEGEVCCGRLSLSRQECLDQAGIIVSDIGDGTMHRADYMCESNGESPIGTIVREEGEPPSDEGEVCCGAASEAETDGEDEEGLDTSAATVVGSMLVSALMMIPFWIY